MGSKPLISVCIPCYNGERFIADTLQSLLNQSVSDFEIVVVDDCSTDRTSSIVKTFTDKKIRFVENQSNLGLCRNWDKTMSLAQGKYVKLLCGDDILYADCLAHQLEILEAPSNSGIVLTLCNRNVIDAAGHVVWRRKPAFKSGRTSGKKLIRDSIRRGSNLIGEPAVGMFRRDALKRTPVLDSANPYLADLTLWAELLRRGDGYIDHQILAAFRISRSAASARIGIRQAAFFGKFARSIWRDPFYGVNTMDLCRGWALSYQWCLLRNAFIRLHSGKLSSSFNPKLSRLEPHSAC